MYDTRFRKWGISKIMKTSEKELLLQEIAQRGSHDVSNISDKNMKKIIRHVQSKSKTGPALLDLKADGRRLSQKTLSHEGNEGVSEPTPSRLPGDEYIHPSILENDDCLGTAMLMSPPTTVESDDENRECSDFSMSRETSSCPILTPSSGHSIPATQQNSSSSPTPPFDLSSPASRNKDLVLHNVKTYYSSRLETLVKDPSMNNVMSIGSSIHSERFWSNVKNGIYLWKIKGVFPDRNHRALLALNEANSLADLALQSEPMDFCREILATLSPANTSIFPPLRHHILSYLGHTARRLFGEIHPIAQLCLALREDQSGSDVSQSALMVMYDIFNDQFGPSHQASHKIMDTMITLMRRSGELEAGEELSKTSLELAKVDFGEHSNQARMAAIERAHILTKLEDHGRALSLRLGVVERPLRFQDTVGASLDSEVQYHHDKISAHTMEDLAEYFVRFGNVQEGIVWLSRAKSIADDIWGDNIATGHIADKLDNLLQGVTDGQVVDGKIAVPVR